MLKLIKNELFFKDALRKIKQMGITPDAFCDYI